MTISCLYSLAVTNNIITGDFPEAQQRAERLLSVGNADESVIMAAKIKLLICELIGERRPEIISKYYTQSVHRHVKGSVGCNEKLFQYLYALYCKNNVTRAMLYYKQLLKMLNTERYAVIAYEYLEIAKRASNEYDKRMHKMELSKVFAKLEEYILNFKGVHIEETAEGKVFYLVSKPFAAIFSETIEIKAKNDYNETIRTLHNEISEAEIMGDGWNSIKYSENLPFEVISDMADRGYRMTYASLPKKVQQEIEEYYHG